jgi:sortase (surface protein transpeptidase)
VLAAGSVLIGLGVVVGTPDVAVDAGTVPSVGPVPASGARASDAPIPRLAVPVGPPVRLRIPVQGLDVAVVAVDVTDDGGLGVPDDPAVVGWWRDGATPGDRAGSVVLDGHVDTYDRGPGALFRLARLSPGDAVQLVLPTATAEYRVAAVRSYTKADLPSDVFDRTGAPRLVLISCGGPFDRARRSYRDNIVVYGVPVDGRAPGAAQQGSVQRVTAW